MGLRDKIAGFVGLDDDLSRLRHAMPATRYRFPDVVELEACSTIGDYTVNVVDLLVIVSALVMMVGVDQFVRRSRLGRGIRAVAQDPESAALMGVNSTG